MNEQEKNALCKSVYKSESYTIGQLSKLAGVSTRTLRYYEDQGLLSSARDKTDIEDIALAMLKNLLKLYRCVPAGCLYRSSKRSMVALKSICTILL